MPFQSTNDSSREAKLRSASFKMAKSLFRNTVSDLLLVQFTFLMIFTLDSTCSVPRVPLRASPGGVGALGHGGRRDKGASELGFNLPEGLAATLDVVFQQENSLLCCWLFESACS